MILSLLSKTVYGLGRCSNNCETRPKKYKGRAVKPDLVVDAYRTSQKKYVLSIA